MGFLKYANGWGHLIMSVFTMSLGAALVVHGDTAAGVSLIGLVSSAWFIPGAARQVADRVTTQVTDVTKPLHDHIVEDASAKT